MGTTLMHLAVSPECVRSFLHESFTRQTVLSTGLSRHKLPSRCAVTIHTRESYNQVKRVTTLTGCCLVLTSSSFLPFRVNSFLQSAPKEASQSHP